MDGSHCQGCSHYSERQGRILIIKLGAAGDVIRTTPLLEPLQQQYPGHAISWVTEFPDLVPDTLHDVLLLNTASRLWIDNVHWDLVINLDKDREACALATEVQARQKIGFVLDGLGMCCPAIEGVTKEMAKAVQDKFLTGIFDDVNQACTLSYPQEIFAICGYEFKGEKYLLPRSAEVPSFDIPTGKPVVGLNTGAGGRWPSRLWPEKYWKKLIADLMDQDRTVLLLGGPQEDEKNQRLAEETGATYLGYFELPVFIELMDRCQVVVTAVTMAMHIALGLGKELVLFNNIFNPHEFELYDHGVIVAPEQKCTCFFQPRCTHEKFCLETLKPETVLAQVQSRLEQHLEEK